MSILEQFQHSDTFSLMSLADKTAATGYVILLGMGITFAALILIWAATSFMSLVVRRINGSAADSSSVKSAGAALTAAEESSDEDLVAVLTAAAAVCLNTSVNNIRVTNIRRVEDATPVWGKAGRRRIMDSALR
ncbi:MAG: sodium pump decarboxylase subunit gamma [Spirochaetales bacterium]|nr:MAG: sodium pump decarboxylase subunit gamma [Spirochaetales bacterium]